MGMKLEGGESRDLDAGGGGWGVSRATHSGEGKVRRCAEFLFRAFHIHKLASYLRYTMLSSQLQAQHEISNQLCKFPYC